MVTVELNALIYPYPWGRRGQERQKCPHAAGAGGFPQVPQQGDVSIEFSLRFPVVKLSTRKCSQGALNNTPAFLSKQCLLTANRRSQQKPVTVRKITTFKECSGSDGREG